ncbi:unnamed protein product [Euphydryas editha]|uniref:Uncharacterized protein n=1 Tax=Euphydryas editha TaxID=104508 RepID=A0AAU9U8Z9_EUPED|nr:unnamed protein product [Euphydryas editha]
MGSGKSKASTREGFIKHVKNEDAAELFVQEHKDLMNKENKGTFSASIAAGFGDCQNENEGLYYDHSRVVFQTQMAPKETSTRAT